MTNHRAGGHTHERVKENFKRLKNTEFEELEEEKTKAIEGIGEACYNFAILCERTRDYYTACAYMHMAYKHLPYNVFVNLRRHKNQYMTYVIYENMNVKGVKFHKHLYSVKGILNERERESKDYRKVDHLYIKRFSDLENSWAWANY